MFNFWKTVTKRVRRAALLPQTKPKLEGLEERLVPYAVSGNAWPVPQLITISFVPDGTVLGYNGQGQAITSTMFADFANLGTTATWEKQILKAAQTWAQQTNINFAVVPDNGADTGSGLFQQGDPGFGDIRIGGYQEGSGSNYPLASAYLPPPVNNYSIAGDITFNTAQAFNIGSTYDLFTVAEHEMGHALGMLHSASNTAVMYPSYTGVFTGLGSDDIAGIRSIYSAGAARSVDAYNVNGPINTFATAAAVTVDPVLDTALVTGLDITKPSEVEMFKFTAPLLSSSTMTITVQSAGLSLLAPKLYVYNALDQQIAFVNGANQYGTTLTTTLNVSPLQQYYVKVMGADTTAFGTGAYGLVINTGILPSPTVPTVDNSVLNGLILQNGGGQALNPGGYTWGSAAAWSASVQNWVAGNAGNPDAMAGPSAVMPPNAVLAGAAGDFLYPDGDPPLRGIPTQSGGGTPQGSVQAAHAVAGVLSPPLTPGLPGSHDLVDMLQLGQFQANAGLTNLVTVVDISAARLPGDSGKYAVAGLPPTQSVQADRLQTLLLGGATASDAGIEDGNAETAETVSAIDALDPKDW